MITLTLEKRSKLGLCNSLEPGNGCLLQLALGHMHNKLQGIHGNIGMMLCKTWMGGRSAECNSLAHSSLEATVKTHWLDKLWKFVSQVSQFEVSDQTKRGCSVYCLCDKSTAHWLTFPY